MPEDPEQLRLQRRRQALGRARRRWTVHRQRCAPCARACRGLEAACSRGRPLLYAIEAAQLLLETLVRRIG